MWKDTYFLLTQSNMVEETLKEFGKFIKDCRKENGLTQAKVAEKSNVAPKTIYNIENGGSVSIRILIRILNVLNLQLKVYEGD